jgi:hypothetical protein
MNPCSKIPKLLIAAVIGIVSSVYTHSAPEDSKAAYEAALAATKAGDYAKALERHEWFRTNGHKIDPSMMGVRNSYALTAWVKLGAKYPPALVSLKKLRDEGVAKITAGKVAREDFSDVAAINRVLSESNETLRLFKFLDGKFPDVAKSCFNHDVKNSLFEAKEYAAYLRYIGDPKEALQKAISLHSEGIAEAKRGGAAMENRLGYEMRTLAKTTNEIATAVAAEGNPSLAAELRAMTTKAQPDIKLP